MSDETQRAEDELRQREHDALRAGARFLSDAEWAAYVAEAAVRNRAAFFDFDCGGAALTNDPTRRAVSRHVTGDRVAIRASELLGVEVEIARVKADNIRLRERNATLSSAFVRAYDPTTEAIRYLEDLRAMVARMPANHRDRVMVAALVAEVDDYRAAAAAHREAPP